MYGISLHAAHSIHESLLVRGFDAITQPDTISAVRSADPLYTAPYGVSLGSYSVANLLRVESKFTSLLLIYYQQ